MLCSMGVKIMDYNYNVVVLLELIALIHEISPQCKFPAIKNILYLSQPIQAVVVLVSP